MADDRVGEPCESPSITNLTPELKQLIFASLSVRQFINLTSCNSTLYHGFQNDPTYWAAQVRKTYGRVPAHLARKKKPWKWLYETLATQTQLFTWGSNISGCLGHVDPFIPGYERLAPYPNTLNSGSPKEPWVPIYLGVLTEVQCGGWCTILLNAEGALFVMGTIHEPTQSPARHGYHLRSLQFPPDWRFNPDTAVRQYSTGRSTVLGLSVAGAVWQWSSDVATLLHFPQLQADQPEVLMVKSGWNRQAILVKGVGIAYWSSDQASDIVVGGQQQTLSPGHRMTVNTVPVPGTSYHPDLASHFAADSFEAQVGQVKDFILLESYVVFTTAEDRIFSFVTTYPLAAPSRLQVVELTTFYPSSANANDSQRFEIRSLAGSFRTFAIITANHGVMFGTQQDLLEPFHNIQRLSSLPHPKRPPTLQNGDVVSLSFGDWHLHALHTSGSVTSLGFASAQSGALGLRNRHIAPLPPWSGTRAGTHNKPIDSKIRRTVRFEPLIDEWIEKLSRNIVSENQNISLDMARWSAGEQDAYAEGIEQWIEKESAKWINGVRGRPDHSPPAWHYDSGRPPLKPPYPWQLPIQTYQESTYNHHSRQYQHPPTATNDDIPPYFALQIAAGGWHSAALVIVDQFKVKNVRDVYRVKKPTASATSEDTRRGMLGGLLSLGRRFLGLEQRDKTEAEQEKWVWERERLPSRLLKRPVLGDSMRDVATDSS